MAQWTAAADRGVPTAVDGAVVATAQREIAARLERLPITATHVRARLIVGLATFFDGFDAIAIAYVLPVLVGLWGLKPAQIGLLISGTYVGQVLGALFFPWIAERIGRLSSTAASAGVFGLASLLCALTWNLPSLLVARFVQGCGLGGEVPVAATYINEIARAPTRGRFFLLYETSFAIGYVGAAGIGVWLVPRVGWESMFLVGALPAFVAAVMRRLLPESPRWLASKGRVAEADAVVTRMENEAKGKGAALAPLDLGAVPPVAARKTKLRELFAPLYANRTMVVWTMWFCQFFTTQSINTWLPTIYKTQLHLTVQQSLAYSFVSTTLSIFGLIASALLLDHTGRRAWFAWMWPIGSVPLFALAYLGIGNTALVVTLATFSSFCHGTCSAPLYVYTPELYPTRMRAFACGSAAMARNIGATLSPTLVGIVLASYGISHVFLMLGLVPLVSAFVVTAWGIETKQRVLEEISP